jgi:hypothetical protein
MDEQPTQNTNTEPYSAPAPVVPTPPEHKKGKGMLISILLIVIFLGLGLGGGYYWGKMNQDKAVSDAKTAAQAQTDKQVADAKKTAALAALAPAKTVTDTTCNADELSLSETDSSDSGAGTLAYNIVFMNTGKRTCTMNGFPGVSLVDANGNQVGSPAGRATNYKEAKQTLTPGMKVKAVISTENSANVSDGTCKTGATKIRVYPPNDTGYISTATVIDSWCPNFETSPVVAF